MAALVAIAAVLYRAQAVASEEQAWAQLAHPDYASGTVQGLTEVRKRAMGSSLEPWISYQLATQLFEEGGERNFAQAAQIAQETLERHPSHAVEPLFRDLIEAIDSYKVAPPEQSNPVG